MMRLNLSLFVTLWQLVGIVAVAAKIKALQSWDCL
jgi:hypothetical protein